LDASFLVAILPHLDQFALFNSINHSSSIFSVENRSIHAVSCGVFACPSDAGAGSPRTGYPSDTVRGSGAAFANPMPVSFTSYAGCGGSRDSGALPDPDDHCRIDPRTLADVNGSINTISPMPLSAIQDGLSDTMVVAEKATFTFREIGDPEDNIFETSGFWFHGSVMHTTFSAAHPPNSSRFFPVTSGRVRVTSASSLHPGGLNILMGDGSVRFVKETIQSASRPYVDPPGLWQALATRAGGEILDASSY